MRVVHVNTYDGNGGAGRAVLRLNKGLNQIGVISEVLCLYKFNNWSQVYAVSDGSFGKFRALLNILLERFLVRLYLKDKSIPFSLQRFGISPNHLRKLKDVDIIHLHWINHGFFSPSDIKELQSLNKKVVWTVHDSNPITGGCHVRYGCENYKSECGNCPALKNASPKDLSNRTWNLKERAYRELTFDFIGVSRWMAERIKDSSLSKQKRVHTISNALETDLFKPESKQEVRKRLDISNERIVILAGYMPSKSDRHKGFAELKATLNILSQKTIIDKKNLLFLFYGGDGSNAESIFPVDTKFMGKISDDSLLVDLYNAADVFVFPSLEESMGYTALESLSCGTPVAAFNTSGVTDVVIHKYNGYLAEIANAEDLANGIIWILENKVQYNLETNARQWSINNFSLDIVASKHKELYSNLLSKKL